jgi:hypothetical protein
MTDRTTAEVAEELRCSDEHVRVLAKRLNVGYNLGGRAGWRFPEADIAAMKEALRPVKPVNVRRRRRAA